MTKNHGSPLANSQGGTEAFSPVGCGEGSLDNNHLSELGSQSPPQSSLKMKTAVSANTFIKAFLGTWRTLLSHAQISDPEKLRDNKCRLVYATNLGGGR